MSAQFYRIVVINVKIKLMVDLNHDWHYVRIVHAGMVHFLRQLQAFYQLEVVECSWSVLVDFVEKRTGDLDALIHAHRVFLERLVRKVLLSAGKRDKEVCFTELYKPCGGY